MEDNLNPNQREAVHYAGGPLLMAAGAGSGKTKALTSRLKALVERGIKPEEIIAITFTNKAAEEMRERVFGKNTKKPNGGALITPGLPFIGTFHSLGARILKQEAVKLGRSAGFSIFDDDDSQSLIKKIIKEMDLPKDRFRPPVLLSKISDVKSELGNPDDFFNSEDDYERIVASLFARYETELLKNNAFDFDDLIEKPVRLFQAHPELLTAYQRLFTHILVDEYQDINTAQYQLVRLLAQQHNNVSVVGDDAQCFLPGTLVTTPTSKKKIELLKKGQKILTASGNGQMCETKITNIKTFDYTGPIVKITTADQQTMRLTPNHLVFVRPQLTDNIHYVYLMYRKDKGFRIGLAKGSRWGPRNKRQIGLIVRSNQERADKIWILKVCSDRAEAEYYEYYYAFRYGIPTLVFDTNNRSMRITQALVDKLFSAIDTSTRVQKLMKDELLYFSYPHWVPQGTIRHSARRLRVRLALFDDRRKSLASPWGMSRISINTSDKKLKTTIEKLGLKTRKGKSDDWRMEVARLNYGELEKIVDRLSDINTEIECVRSACLTKNKRLYFQPASHVRPTMAIAVKRGGLITEKIVTAVEIETYRGPVYDLNIQYTHNYIANNFVVHNSIYSFRGADFRNFLNFERDWPNAKIVKLEQNYRSSGNIIAAASAVIKQNKLQKPKELWTENPDGELIKMVSCEDPETESVWVANEIRAIREKDPSVTIAIMYRTNAQSRPLEQALISENLPYTIFGGLKFYQRKEIKDLVAALRVAANPADDVGRERVEKALGKRLAAILLAKLPEVKDLPPVELISFFMRTANYKEYLEQKFNNPAERMENIAELINFASQFSTLQEFLERILLLQSSDVPSEKRTGVGRAARLAPITLMTIHVAKGLEFDYVFIAGVNEGLLPHEKSMLRVEDVEEERRLMYVAMTRARKVLYILFHSFPSRFLYEVPRELLQFISPSGLMDNLPDEDEMWLEN